MMLVRTVVLTIVLQLALVLLALTAEGAVSLWPNDAGSMFADHRASAVGDLVTIVVVESTTGTTQGATAVTKSFQVDLATGTGLFAIVPEATFQSSAAGSTDRSASQRGSLQARITVRVKDVLAGGVLRLEGSRDVLIKGEAYKLTISGLVRRVDIAADNTVPSTLIADSRIVLEGGRSTPQGGQRGPLRWIIEGFHALLRVFF